MISVILSLIVLLQWTPVSGDNVVTQNPDILWEVMGKSAIMNCTHTKDAGYYQMYWYRQRQGESLELIVYTTVGVEPDFGSFDKNKFSAVKEHYASGSFIVKNLDPSDSAVYFCMISRGAFGSQAYFGDGTKLTVLEKGRSAESPKVEILNVSSTEVCNKEAVTLVCLASKFYPDHVSVSWDMNGEEMGNVATDNAATRDDKYYSISSRLQIPYQTWTTGKTFTCTVKFFNGTGYENHPASIRGPVDSGRNEAATFVKSGKTTMLAYGMIIVKSVIYGIFIIVVIKKQDFRGK